MPEDYVQLWLAVCFTEHFHPVLPLSGPCMSTDTACSSSLVATHLAHASLVSTESIAAVAGGVNIMLAPLTTVAICQLQVG